MKLVSRTGFSTRAATGGRQPTPVVTHTSALSALEPIQHTTLGLLHGVETHAFAVDRKKHRSCSSCVFRWWGGGVVGRQSVFGSASGPPGVQGIPFMFTMASGDDRLPVIFLVYCEPPAVVGHLFSHRPPVVTGFLMQHVPSCGPMSCPPLPGMLSGNVWPGAVVHACRLLC